MVNMWGLYNWKDHFNMNDKNNPFLKSLLEDNSGGFSSARFMALTWCIGTFIVWAVASLLVIYTSAGTATPVVTLMPIPWEVVTMALGFGGYKVAQRFGEKPEVENSK